MSKYFTSNLNYLMKVNNMKQKDLAIRTGASISSINDYVKGRMIPKYDKLEWISVVFNIDVATLLNVDISNTEDEEECSDRTNTLLNNFIVKRNVEYYKQNKISETDKENLEKLIDNYFEMKKQILEDN